MPMTSGLSVMLRVDTADGMRWQGAADPRRDGTARGADTEKSDLMQAR